MIILGIDPGSRKAGYAFIEKKGRTLRLLDSGVLRYDKEKEFLLRLGDIYQSIKKLCHEYQPDEVAFESLIYVKSVTSLAKLAQARGAMIAACMELKRGHIYEYSPNSIKSCISGFGHADKEGLLKALKLYFGPLQISSHDESDAIAIAACHALGGGGKISSKGQSLAQAFKHLA
jgi:crossover junction endodeoxyribonuclease RuvC